jgi:hypothetical protein
MAGITMPWPVPRSFTVWSEQWHSPINWLESLETSLKGLCKTVTRGGDFDRWDLELRGGLMGSIRLLMAVEEHGGGKQLVRFRAWPRCYPVGIALTLLFAGLSAAAAFSEAWITCAVLNFVAFLFMIRIYRECASAMSAVVEVVNTEKTQQ